MTVSNNWSEWWRSFLGLAPDGYHKALEILSQRYIEESRHTARLKQQAKRMQYPQFRDKLLAIAADEAKHVEWIAEKIKLYGGRLPDVPPIAAAEMNSWQYLLEDLSEEQQWSAELIEQAHSVRGALPDVGELLDRIYQDGKRHRNEIREMLMKSDPQAFMSA